MIDPNLQALNDITDERHYLKRDSPRLPTYQQSYAENIHFLFDRLTSKQQKALLNDKLMFKRVFDTIQEKRFIQSACETTVTSFFAQRFADSFEYEPRINKTNNANAECRFKLGHYTVNIEVKCPSFDRIEAQDLNNHFHINLPQRMNMELIGFIAEGLNKVTEQEGALSYVVPHRMDNNLKDYLKSANTKFAEANTPTDINILVVCCDDAKSMQRFVNYLFQPDGFFNLYTDSSLLSKDEYKNVDVVILANLYYKHRSYFNKPNVIAHWDFFDSFNLIFDNLHREHVDSKIDGIDYIRYQILPNHTFQLLNFIEDLKKGDKQQLPVDFLESVGLEYYIRDLAKRGIIFF